MNHWRIYPPSLAVEVTPEQDAFAKDTTFHVFADLGDGEIGFDIDGVCLVSFGIDQIDTLIERLQTARDDVRAAAQRPPLTARGDEGHCEGCSERVLAGQPIVVEDEGTKDCVVLHAGQCPATQLEGPRRG